MTREGSDNVVQLATRAGAELIRANPLLRHSVYARGDKIIKAINSSVSTAAKLKVAILKDTSLGALRGGWIQSRGVGRSMRDFDLCYLLLHEVMMGNSANQFVAQARAFAESETCVVDKYTALGGVAPTRAMTVSKGMELIPWTEVPNSAQKGYFDKIPSLELPSALWFPLPASKPSLAIRHRETDQQLLFSSPEDAPGGWNEDQEMSGIADFVRCATVLAACPVRVLGTWTAMDNPVVAQLVGESSSWPLDAGVFDRPADPVEIDERVVSTMKEFSDFKTDERSVMRIALDRVNSALRERRLVDKAIDLGIALEVMLLHGINSKDRGEIRFRLSVRGATFLGGTKEERLRTMNILKDTYDLRSAAVHSGNVTQLIRKVSSVEVLAMGTSTCCRIARRLIERGSFPQYDSDFVVGED